MSAYKMLDLALLLSMTNVGGVLGDITTTYSVAGAAPSGSSRTVPNDFVAFAIEGGSFPYYTGVTNATAGTFTRNLLNNFFVKTGIQPVIRVGGTTADFAVYNPAQTEPITNRNGGPYITGNYIAGPSYFSGFGMLPSQWIFDIPYASGNVTNYEDFAREAYNNIAPSQRRAWELGNEPNVYYKGSRAGKANSNSSVYTTHWQNTVQNISNTVGIALARNWEGLALAYPNDGPQPKINTINCFEDGIDNINGTLIMQSVSIHHYQSVTGIVTPDHNPQQSALNHTAITGGLKTFLPNVQYLYNTHPDIQLVLGETGTGSPMGVNGTASQITYARALWVVDLMLYSMSVNIKRINMQQGNDHSGSGWHAVDKNGFNASVLPIFYGYLFAADAVGSESDIQVYQLSDNTNQMFSAYSIYSQNALKRIALVNLVEYESGGRPSATVTLTLPTSVSTLTATKLIGPAASATTGVLYASQMYNYPDGTPVPATSSTTTIPVTQNTAVVTIEDSAAFLLNV